MRFLFYVLTLASACNPTEKPAEPPLAPATETKTTTTTAPPENGKESKVTTTTTTPAGGPEAAKTTTTVTTTTKSDEKPASDKHPKVKPEADVETISLPTGDGGAMETWTLDEACAQGTAQFLGHKHECQAVDAARITKTEPVLQPILVKKNGFYEKPGPGGKNCVVANHVELPTKLGEEEVEICAKKLSLGEDQGGGNFTVMVGNATLNVESLEGHWFNNRDKVLKPFTMQNGAEIRCSWAGITYGADGIPTCTKPEKVDVEAATAPASDAIKDAANETKPNKE